MTVSVERWCTWEEARLVQQPALETSGGWFGRCEECASVFSQRLAQEAKRTDGHGVIPDRPECTHDVHMRWKDYLQSHHEDGHPYLEAVRAAVLQLRLRRGGDWHQTDERGAPVFSDGTAATFSFRAWGDLLAAVWSEAEGKDYSYMDFYMDSMVPA